MSEFVRFFIANIFIKSLDDNNAINILNFEDVESTKIFIVSLRITCLYSVRMRENADENNSEHGTIYAVYLKIIIYQCIFIRIFCVTVRCQ